MGKLIILGLALALLLGLPLAGAKACPEAERVMHIPAVVSDQEGGLLEVHVVTQPGDGYVYTDISPLVGVSTQLSERQAVHEAFARANYNESQCDVTFWFSDIRQTESVDGPSAGLAMTVALEAALENTTLRDDVTITGAILPGARAGVVGGLIDKGQAAARMGQHLFVTPKQQIYENIVLGALEKKYDFRALEVETLAQAYAIATSKTGTAFNTTFKLKNEGLPDPLPPRAMNEDDQRMGEVAARINQELAAQVSEGANGPLAAYQSYFQRVMEDDRVLISKGYGYTAANNAFLAQVDAAFLTTPPNQLDVDAEMARVQGCVESTPDAKLTERNLEWVAGAAARLSWAVQKIKDVQKEKSNFDSSESKYLAVRELYYAMSWCEAAHDLLAQAQSMEEGAPIDAEALKEPASAAFKKSKALMDNADSLDPDAAWHYKVANQSFAAGNWLGTLYDSAYVQGTQATADQTENKTSEELINASRELAQANLTTLWGRTYQSQGQYMVARAASTNGSASSAYDVLRLAASMEEGMTTARNHLSGPPIGVQVAGANPVRFGERQPLDPFVGTGIALGMLYIGWGISKKVRKQE